MRLKYSLNSVYLISHPGIDMYNIYYSTMRKLVFLVTMLFIYVEGIWSQMYTLESKWVDCGNNVQLNDPYYSSGVTFQWSGGSKNGKANGFGIATKYKDGSFESKFEGTYKNGIREGKGKFTHMDGSVKTGTFVDGQLVGHGTLTTEDGHTYEGEFINYRMHGKGVLRLANGAVFEGVMANDAPYTGKFTNYDGSITYIQSGEPVERLQDTKSDYSPKIGKRITEYFDKDWNMKKDSMNRRISSTKSPYQNFRLILP